MKNAAGAPGRLYYLDWIRVLAMFCIFLFHNARFFDGVADWHVKNATTNLAATFAVGTISQFIMPLFFLVAGAGTFLALKARSPGQYALERALRLLIPLVLGMLVIVVPQAYFQAIFRGTVLEGYNLFQIYGLYLQSLPEMNWFHLWFLKNLFIISLVAIPFLFSWGRGGRSLVARLSSFFDKPWTLLPLLVAAIAAVNIFLYPGGFWGHRGDGAWNFVTYVLFFILGYLIFANPGILKLVQKMRWIGLGVALISVCCMIIFFFEELASPAEYFGSPAFAIATLVQALDVWGWLIAIVGFGSRYLNRNNRFLAYANEAVLPFYILHQTLIITIGYYVVQWSAGVGLKYLTISVTSFIGIMLIYELLVRRLDVLRFLFGMRLRRRPRPIPVSAAQN